MGSGDFAVAQSPSKAAAAALSEAFGRDDLTAGAAASQEAREDQRGYANVDRACRRLVWNDGRAACVIGAPPAPTLPQLFPAVSGRALAWPRARSSSRAAPTIRALPAALDGGACAWARPARERARAARRDCRDGGAAARPARARGDGGQSARPGAAARARGGRLEGRRRRRPYASANAPAPGAACSSSTGGRGGRAREPRRSRSPRRTCASVALGGAMLVVGREPNAACPRRRRAPPRRRHRRVLRHAAPRARRRRRRGPARPPRRRPSGRRRRP